MSNIDDTMAAPVEPTEEEKKSEEGMPTEEAAPEAAPTEEAPQA